jgi:hypothetical protein
MITRRPHSRPATRRTQRYKIRKVAQGSAGQVKRQAKVKERSEEKDWSWPCRTWLTESRISVRHDPTNPGFRRASGGEGSTDNERVPEHMRMGPEDPDPCGLGYPA